MQKLLLSSIKHDLGYYRLQTATHQRLPPEGRSLWNGSPDDGQLLQHPLPC